HERPGGCRAWAARKPEDGFHGFNRTPPIRPLGHVGPWKCLGRVPATSSAEAIAESKSGAQGSQGAKEGQAEAGQGVASQTRGQEIHAKPTAICGARPSRAIGARAKGDSNIAQQPTGDAATAEPPTGRLATGFLVRVRQGPWCAFSRSSSIDGRL